MLAKIRGALLVSVTPLITYPGYSLEPVDRWSLDGARKVLVRRFLARWPNRRPAPHGLENLRHDPRENGEIVVTGDGATARQPTLTYTIMTRLPRTLSARKRRLFRRVHL